MRLSSSWHLSDKTIHLPGYTATVCVRFEFFCSALSPCAVHKMPLYVTLINTRSMKSPSPSPPGCGLRGVLVVSPVFVFSVRHGFIDVVRELSQSVFLDAFAKLRKVIVSVVMSIRLSAWNDLAPPGRIFTKFGI